MSKHTPGPFRAVPPTQWTKEWTVMAHNFTVASGIDRESNAHLFSAAPELLEACKAALFCLREKSKVPGFPETAQQLEEAIAKAEGRE